MTLHEWEREHILTVLVKTDWNLDKASHLLRISVSELQQKIRGHRLEGSKNAFNEKNTVSNYFDNVKFPQ
jgi:DNA-binding NtrC family response regulator